MLFFQRLSAGFLGILILGYVSGVAQTQTYRSVDAALSASKEVKVLDLSGKGLTAFPDEITRLKNLQEVDFSPEQMIIYRGDGPESINGNHIPYLPEDIQKLSNLRSLNLQATGLQQLPDGMGQLQDLAFLDLSYNPHLNAQSVLKVLPQLSNLKFVDLSGCPLSDQQLLLLKNQIQKVVVQF